MKIKVFGIDFNGDQSVIESGDRFDDIKHITSLEEELSQSDRFMGIN